MTLDEALQGGEHDVKKILAMTEPSKIETFWFIVRCLLAVIFPWMEPDKIIS